MNPTDMVTALPFIDFLRLYTITVLGATAAYAFSLITGFDGAVKFLQGAAARFTFVSIA